MAKKHPNANKAILLLCVIHLCISLVITLILTKGGRVIEEIDPYTPYAKNLLSKGFFSYDGVTPDYIRTPGYPLLIAAVYVLGGNDFTIIIVHIILNTVRLYLFYQILILLKIKQRLALFGSALYCMYAHQYLNIFNIQTEPLFNMLLMLSLYFMVKYLYQAAKFRYFAGFSLALNYALFTRPVLIYCNMILLPVFLLLAVLRKISFKCFAVFSLCFIVTFGGWSFRNYVHSSIFIFSTISKVTMLSDRAAITDIYLHNPDKNLPDIHGLIEASRHKLYEEFLTQYPEAGNGILNPAQISLLQAKYGTAFIMRHFPYYIKANVMGLVRMLFSGFGFYGSLNRFPLGISVSIKTAYIIYLFYLGFIYILYLAGLFVNKTEKAIHLGLFFLIGYLTAVSAIYGNKRYMDPFFPLLLLSAVAASPAVIKLCCSKIRNSIISRVGAFLLE